MKTIHEVLIDTRSILEERGMAKHHLCDYKGSVCLRGALNIALHGNPYFSDNYNETLFRNECERALGFEDYVGGSVLPDWNNNPRRKIKHLFKRLDKAIEATRSRLEAPVEDNKSEVLVEDSKPLVTV